MQNSWKQILIELAPSFLIVMVLIFGLFIASRRVKKKNTKTIADLKEQSPEKWKKVIKYNAYLKLVLWSAFGIFWFGGGIYNFLHFPEGNKLPALFMVCLGIGFISLGIWSYFREIKKIQ